ncbi:MAG: carboxypeptidase regulatory-like domain-containing protein [Thermincola sp.]|jgi:L-ascorbate metabolism protein UlaG (beta-lactamase superfamily)|nr:carboxypeptidase regulatory-like domain-containing protein [Thermincola sp.]MDT3702033.1 carboxypeptidase regulatory-like domain-containing protein [Thermincola sp.]
MSITRVKRSKAISLILILALILTQFAGIVPAAAEGLFPIPKANIQFLSHETFVIRSDSGTTILTDPGTYFNPSDLNGLVPNGATISHGHNDHYNPGALAGIANVVYGTNVTGDFATDNTMFFPRNINIGDIVVSNVYTNHFVNHENDANSVFTFDVNGVKIMHVGDPDGTYLGISEPNPTPDMVKQLNELKAKKPDVLIVNVMTGGETVSVDKVVYFIDQINPKVIIPAHTLYSHPNDFIDYITANKPDYQVKFTNGNSADVSTVSLPQPGQKEVWVMNSGPYSAPPTGGFPVPFVEQIHKIVSGSNSISAIGQNLDQVVAGAVYSGTNKVAQLGMFNWNPGNPGFLEMNLPDTLAPGPYVTQLVYGGGIVGGQSDFMVVPPLGIDRIFVDGTKQKIVVVPNGNDIGDDISFLRATIIADQMLVQESVYNSEYSLASEGGNLVINVPDNFNYPSFMVQLDKKSAPDAPWEFVSHGFLGQGGAGPQYNVMPGSAAPGESLPIDIFFGPNFDSTTTVAFKVYSLGAWVDDSAISPGPVEVVNDHIRVPVNVAADAAAGPRKIAVTTAGKSPVEIIKRFSIMYPMITTIAGNDIVIDPNGNEVGDDPSKIKLRVFSGPYPAGEITNGFNINAGKIIVPLSLKPELQFAKDFAIEVIRITDHTMLGRAHYMKPGVGPSTVMAGSLNIPLDIWAPGLTKESSVVVKVYGSGTWNVDPNFIFADTTRQIIQEPGNIGGATQHYQVMMTVKDVASIGPRRIEVTGPGAVVIDNALTVMPGMSSPGTGGPGAEVPFMVGGSNVAEMGTVSPAVSFIGIGFTRPIMIGDENRNTVKNAIQIQKLVDGVPSGASVNGIVANPPMPPVQPDSPPPPEANVVLFKPSAPLDESSVYRLTIAKESLISTGENPQALSTTYSVDFNTGTMDNTAPSIVKVDIMPSPTDGAIIFQFDKPLNEQEVTQMANYNIVRTPDRPIPGDGVPKIKYDPMMNMVKIVGFDLAMGDQLTGTVSGIHSATGTEMTLYNIDATVQGFQMGAGAPMTNTQMAFSPVEVKPTNPSANAESHYFIRLPINQKLSAGDTIEIVFPAGFNVTSAVLDSGSPMNKDINGPGPGTVTVRSVSAENISRLVTVTLNNETGDHDFIQFELKGIINGPTKQITFDPNTGLLADGYYSVVTTKSGGSVVEGPLNSMLFPISEEVSGSIGGYIKNKAGTGIGNVRLYLDGPNGRKESLSGDNGSFNFTGLAPGGYYLSTEPAPDSGNYVGLTMPLKFFIDVFGSPNINAGDIILDSTVGGAITYYSLTVNITSGPASKEVDVFAGSPTAFYVQTFTLGADGRGSATLKVKPGNYMVGVGPAMPKGGFTGPAPIIDWMPPMPTPKEITKDETVNIVIDVPNATITGTVKDSSNNPIPNANVHAYSPSGNSMGAGAVTNSQGVYSLKVKAGEYSVGVNAPGMPWLPEKRIKIGDGLTVNNVNFVFEALERTISGIVTDSDNRPIAKASVVAYRVDSGDINTAKPLPGFANATTDSSGNFTLFVKPDSFWVLSGYAPEFGELQKQIIQVGASNISGKQLTAASNIMGTVQGTVKAGLDNVANATIWAEGVNVAFGNKAVTNTNGQYDLKLKAGNYILHLWTPETGEVPLAPEVRNITVTANAALSKDLNIPQKGSITIDFGNQQAGFEAFVQAKSEDGRFQNGGFVKLKAADAAKIKIPLPVPDGGATYQLFIAVPGMGDSNTINEFKAKTASLTAEAPATVVAVTVPNNITLQGTVKVQNEDGVPISEAWVHITQKGAPFGGFRKTDAGGNFSFNLPQGTYVLMVDHPDYLSKPPVTVTVNGNTTQNLFLDPSAGLTISGTLYKNSVLADNKVTSNAVVWAIDETGKFANGVLNSDGTFSIEVTDGTWTVQAAGDGYETTVLNRQKVTLDGESEADINIIMTRLKINGVDYEIKAPKAEPITPAVGGVLDDPQSNVKIIVPANALGSSVDAGQITAKETTGIPTTSLAKPAGNVGKEIKAADASGSAITKLNDYIEIVITYAELVDPDDATKLVDGTPIDSLQLGYWDETAKNWVFIASTNDTTNYVLRGKVDHLTTFAPLVATGEAAPAAPAGLAATAVSSSQINLTWNAADGATEYNIYRSATADGDYAKINTTQVTAASYSNIDLTASTSYYYKVTAVNAGGESAASDNASATTTPAAVVPTPPAVPTGLDADAISSSQIDLTWNAVAGATEYNIYRSATADGEYTKINTTQVTGTSYSSTGLTASTTYYYKVAAVNGAGESAKSTNASATTSSSNGGGGGISPPAPQASDVPEVEKVISDPASANNVKTADGSVELAIAPGTFTAAGGEQIKVTIDKLDIAAVNEILKKSTQPAEIKLVGNVFEFDALTVKSGTSTAVSSFGKPVSVKLSFNGAEANNVDPKKLGVYRLDEASGKWEYVGGKVDAASKTVTVSLSHFSKYAILAYDKTFADVAVHWAKSDVEVAAARHFVSGINTNSFAPDKVVTRAEFAVMLAKAVGLTAADQELSFKDIQKDAWYYGSVAAAVKAGIISGYNAETFAPNAKISREQMASMIARAMRAKGITVTLNQEQVSNNINRFIDGKAVSDWAEADVAAVYDKGIIKGRNTGDFAPGATAIRAEAAVMLNRLFDLI